MISELEGVDVWELPDSWIYAKLEDIGFGDNAIVDGPFGSNLKVSDYITDTENGVPVLTTKNLEGDYSENSVRYISKIKFEELKRSAVRPGDILIAKIGSIGKTGIYPRGNRTAIIPANLLKFTLVDLVEFNYVYAYLGYSKFQSFIKLISTATAQPAFNVTKFRKLPIPIPPAAEQHRIVAKIEALFSELDKGIESFKTAREQLKIYRQALLKHAFSGKLTEQWRAEYRDKLESAETLLQRIQTERQQRYHQQLEDWENSGKQGSKPKAPKTLPPLTAEELAELPELSNGWRWVRIGELVDRVTVGHVGSMKDEYIEVGIPFLRSQNVRENRFDPNGLKYISKSFHDALKKSELCSGDVVVVRSGSVGVSCVVPENLGIANCSDLVIIKNPRHILSELLAYYMNWQTQGRVKGKMVGVALIHFNTKSVEDFAIPLISLNEQVVLHSYIDARFSVIDQLDQTITTALQQAEALRQSILKKAFSGQLVPQDPNDEPAGVLLERIRAEKAASDKPKPRKTKHA